MKVCTVEEMRELDRRAISQHGIPDLILMENAGLAAYEAIREEIGTDAQFCVICGLGNNGGDGFVVARKLWSTGAPVKVLVLGEVDRYGETARTHYEMLAGTGAYLIHKPPMEEIRERLAECDVVVDALLGTGITREVSGTFRETVEAINGFHGPVVSLDIPSGVDGNTGQIRGVAVEADLTVTFGLPKRGNMAFPGAELGGRLFLSHISFPPELWRADHVAVELAAPSILPPRDPAGHKGTFGDSLFVAGAASYFGAPSLSALSHLKAGGGYARLAAPGSLVPFLSGIAPEVVFAPQQETLAGSLSPSAAESILKLAAEVDFVVLGPGLSLEVETRELVRRLVAEIQKPLLVDGDGLTAMADDLDIIAAREYPTCLTPHPGEAARLAGSSVSEMRSDPFAAVLTLSRELGATVVLKGAHSLVGRPDGTVSVNVSGNSGMATAGSGDVLTGTISAMAGLGLPFEEAIVTGVFLHGFAGDLAASENGPDGITARDILESLPLAVGQFREDPEMVVEELYDVVEVI